MEAQAVMARIHPATLVVLAPPGNTAGAGVGVELIPGFVAFAIWVGNTEPEAELGAVENKKEEDIKDEVDSKEEVDVEEFVEFGHVRGTDVPIG